MKKISIVIFIVALMACSNRSNKVANEPSQLKVEIYSIDKEDEDLMKGPLNNSSPKNTKVIAKVVERLSPSQADIDMNSICENHPCCSKIEFLAITYRGSNFHGQYNEGDTATARFTFTLDATESLFPELNSPLPGLANGDFFEAELFENDRGEYTIQIYDKK